jgi:hypothetical protein
MSDQTDYSEFHDFKVGEEVRVKASQYNRRGSQGFNFIQRGQTITLEEADVDRTDAGWIFERITEEETPTSVFAETGEVETPGFGETEPEAIDYSSPDVNQLSEMLSSMTVTKAKAFLSEDDWTKTGMETALQAEEDGQNRSTLIDFIDGRIEQLTDEEDTGAPA